MLLGFNHTWAKFSKRFAPRDSRGLPTAERRFALLLCFALVGLTGCFGPRFMSNDIRSYNQETLNSETEMLLDNIGRLSEHQPPHFMMLATVSQTRTFSATAGFQWTQVLAALNPVTLITRTLSPETTITTTSSSIGRGSTWQAGPFSTSTNENPTITFIPIQGQEFFNRFESPMADRFMYFFQEQIRESANRDDLKYLIKLSAESLYLRHGETSGYCKHGLYLNKAIPLKKLPPTVSGRPNIYGLQEFSSCLNEIVPSKIDLRSPMYVEKIDGHHPVPTKAAADPGAADAITALEKGYEWTKKDKDFVLTTPIRFPAILDYNARFDAPPALQPNLEPALVLYHGPKGRYETQPGPLDLTYGTPKGYSWKQYRNRRGKLSYALVPDGYGVENGGLVKYDKCGQAECASGTCEGGTCVSGRCEPSTCPQCETGQCPDDKARLLYADDIIDEVWPAQSDYVYVELRRNKVFNKAAKKACFEEPPADDESGLICGYFKIGNLLQIMQRLADMAKACEEAKSANNPACKASYVGIGSIVDKPLWADRWVQIGSGLFIYEPAHNPDSQDYYERERATRDREAFANLYKLYLMSLVNTSQLVTSAPPVTISK
jgi:hypothetical protein